MTLYISGCPLRDIAIQKSFPPSCLQASQQALLSVRLVQKFHNFIRHTSASYQRRGFNRIEYLPTIELRAKEMMNIPLRADGLLVC